MKVYLGYKKDEGKVVVGVTVLNNENKVVFSNYCRIEDLTGVEGKFANMLYAMRWGIRQLKLQLETGVLSVNDKLVILIDNKTIYNWFDKDKTVAMYVVQFEDIKAEIRFLVNDAELIYSEGVSKKVIYSRRGGIEVSASKVTDLLSARLID